VKKYPVRLGPFALGDLDSTLSWGIEVWGADEASGWLDGLERHINLRLSEMPLAYPIRT
jgi:plasmid stabilization system protein ParE